VYGCRAREHPPAQAAGLQARHTTGSSRRTAAARQRQQLRQLGTTMARWGAGYHTCNLPHATRV
jgi:hypothetical protein